MRWQNVGMLLWVLAFWIMTSVSTAVSYVLLELGPFYINGYHLELKNRVWVMGQLPVVNFFSCLIASWFGIFSFSPSTVVKFINCLTLWMPSFMCWYQFSEINSRIGTLHIEGTFLFHRVVNFDSWCRL